MKRGWFGLAAALSFFGTAQASESLSVVQACEGVIAIAAAPRVEACSVLLMAQGLSAEQKAFVHYYRALAQQDLGKYDDALTDLDTALGITPSLWPARWIRAGIHHAKRNNAAALSDWDEVIRAAPPLTAADSQRGIVLNHIGRFDESMAAATRALKSDAPSIVQARLHETLAQEYEVRGKFAEAAGEIDRAIKLNDKAPQAFTTLGRINYLRQDWRGAVDALKRSLELDHGDLYAMLWLALARAHLGDNLAAELRRLSAGAELSAWPGPILRVLMGDLTVERVLMPDFPKFWPSADRAKAAQCELSFFRAQAALLSGDRDQAVALLEAAVATNIIEYIEYRSARLQLAQLGRGQ